MIFGIYQSPKTVASCKGFPGLMVVWCGFRWLNRDNHGILVDNFKDRVCGTLSSHFRVPQVWSFPSGSVEGRFFTQHPAVGYRWTMVNMPRCHQSQVILQHFMIFMAQKGAGPTLVSPSWKGWRVPMVSSRRKLRSKSGERSLLPLNIDRKAEENDRQFFLGIFGEHLRLEDKQMLVSHRPESRENLKVLDTFVGLVLFCSWLMSILLKRLFQQLDAWIPFQGNLKKEALPKLGSTHTWFEIRIFTHIKPEMVASLPVLSCHLG